MPAGGTYTIFPRWARPTSPGCGARTSRHRPCTSPTASLYPGDAYVDWTCLDGYNWGTNPWNPNVWLTFSQTFGPSYSNITGSIAPSKPMVIGETASTEYGGSKAAWITDMLKTQLPLNFPKIKGFLWFEMWDSRGYDWPIILSSTSQSAFATNIKLSSYAANQFAATGGRKDSTSFVNWIATPTATQLQQSS